MSQTDLYSLLMGYTGKTNSPYVSVKDFVSFIEKYAARKPAEQTELTQWTFNAETTFRSQLPELVESGKCVLSEDKKGEKVFIPASCRRIIEDAYKDIDRLANIPFPAAASLSLALPDNFAKTINIMTDMGIFFGKPEEAPDAGDIIILQFPQTYGSAMLLASMIPRKLMEISLLKIRNYLQSRNNKEFALNKLIVQMQGKDKILREMIERLCIRPLDCLSEMERSADFPYLFWTYFCPLVKNDIKKRNDLLPDDLSALQAVCVIEICCSFYRSKAAKKREIDAAFMNLEVQMDKIPWHFTLEEIVAFTNDRGIPLLDIYSQNDLEEYIRKAIGESVKGALPPWLVVQGDRGERWFVKKERYLLICTKILLEVQLQVKTAITKRWTRLIRDFDREPAMEKDPEFEKMLERQAKAANPTLKTFLEDPKLHWAYEELDRTPGAIPQPSRIFKNGELLPYSSLFALHRRELLSSIRLRLPFWYSIPIIVSIIAFFKKLGKKKKPAEQPETGDEFVIVEQETSELRKSALLLETALIPEGKNIDEYLVELETRWVRLLDKTARQNLVDDVQSLLRDNLKNAMKVYKLKRITEKGLREMSDLLITRNPALKSIKEKDALRLYMELYMLKLLLTRRV